MAKAFHTGPLTVTINSKVISVKTAEVHYNPTVVDHGSAGGGASRGTAVPIKGCFILIHKDILDIQEMAWAAGYGTSEIKTITGGRELVGDHTKRDCPQYENVTAAWTADNGESWTLTLGLAEIAPSGDVSMAFAENTAIEYQYAVKMLEPRSGVTPLKLTVTGIVSD